MAGHDHDDDLVDYEKEEYQVANEKEADAKEYECSPPSVLEMDISCQVKSGMGKTAVFVLAFYIK